MRQRQRMGGFAPDFGSSIPGEDGNPPKGGSTPKNKWVTKKAEENYLEKQNEVVAPVNTDTKVNRAKDWLRKRLNDDYKRRNN